MSEGNTKCFYRLCHIPSSEHQIAVINFAPQQKFPHQRKQIIILSDVQPLIDHREQRRGGDNLIRGNKDKSVCSSASKSSIRRFVITEKAPTRAFSWLKAATTAFTFKKLLRHYAKQALTPQSLNVKLGPLRNYHKTLS